MIFQLKQLNKGENTDVHLDSSTQRNKSPLHSFLSLWKIATSSYIDCFALKDTHRLMYVINNGPRQSLAVISWIGTQVDAPPSPRSLLSRTATKINAKIKSWFGMKSTSLVCKKIFSFPDDSGDLSGKKLLSQQPPHNFLDGITVSKYHSLNCG